MYDTSLHKFLDSYLRFAPRYENTVSDVYMYTPSVRESNSPSVFFLRSHDAAGVAQLPLKAREVMRNIHRRVFMTYVRMATHKESNVSQSTQCHEVATTTTF